VQSLANDKKEFLELNDIKNVLNVIPNSYIRDKAIIQTLYKTGIRVYELINLKKQDLDLNSNDKVISIKITGKHERTVFIDNETLDLINMMLDNRKKESDFLFIASTGNKLSNNTINKMFKKYAIATDEYRSKGTFFKDNFTANALKQSFINIMLNTADFSVEDVKKLVGQDYLGVEKKDNIIDSNDLKNKYGSVVW
jgi:integrase/recombinase XerD